MADEYVLPDTGALVTEGFAPSPRAGRETFPSVATLFAITGYTPTTVVEWADGDCNLLDPDNYGYIYSEYNMQLDGEGFGGSLANGNAISPKFTVAGSLEPPLSLPEFTVAGSLEPPLSLPSFVMAGTAISGSAVSGNTRLASLTLSATGLAENNTLRGDIKLVMLAADGSTATGGNITLSAPAMSATGYAGRLSVATLRLTEFTVTGTLAYGAILTGSIALAEPALDATGASSLTGTSAGDCRLTALPASGTGATGQIATATVTLPLLTVGADSLANNTGTATIALPVFARAVNGVLNTVLAAPVFTGVTLNTINRAAATYTGVKANSVASFNGLTLVATSDGIVALTGDTDLDSVQIDATATGGVTDFGSSQNKRVIAGYFSLRASGRLELTLITDEHHEYVYGIEPRQQDDIHTTRVKTGRGVDGQNWQWTIANREGADFELHSFYFDVHPLSRRV